MQVTVDMAQSQLSQLIDAALAGEEVVITKGSQPVVRLAPVSQDGPKVGSRSGFKIGLLEGKVGNPPDFFEPMSEEELRLWEGGD